MYEFDIESLRHNIEHAESDGMPIRLEIIDNLISETEANIDPNNQLSSLALSGLKMYSNICHEIHKELVMLPYSTILEMLNIIEAGKGIIVELHQYADINELTRTA
jgi:hypothetical protein